MNELPPIGIFYHFDHAPLSELLSNSLSSIIGNPIFRRDLEYLDEKEPKTNSEWGIVLGSKEQFLSEKLQNYLDQIEIYFGIDCFFGISKESDKFILPNKFPLLPVYLDNWNGSIEDDRITRLSRIVSGPTLRKAGHETPKTYIYNNISGIYDPSIYYSNDNPVIYIENNGKQILNPILFQNLSDLVLSVRTDNSLRNNGTIYIGDLVQISEAEFLRIPNLGRKSLNEIKEVLANLGFRLGLKIEDWPPTDFENQLTQSTIADQLSSLRQAPLGATFEISDEFIKINSSGEDSDKIAASKTISHQLHQESKRKLENLNIISKKLGNSIGWSTAPALFKQMHELLDRPSESIPDVLGSLYGNVLELGSFLEMDNKIKGDDKSDVMELSVDIRRSMDDVLRTVAPWLRTFPSIREIDDEMGQFLLPPGLLIPANDVVETASSSLLVSDSDAQLIVALIDAASRGELQGGKAGRRGVLSARNMIVAAASVVGSVLIGAIGSDYSTKSLLVAKAGSFFASAESAVTELIADMPQDLRLAIEGLMIEIRNTQTPIIPKSLSITRQYRRGDDTQIS